MCQSSRVPTNGKDSLVFFGLYGVFEGHYPADVWVLLRKDANKRVRVFEEWSTSPWSGCCHVSNSKAGKTPPGLLTAMFQCRSRSFFLLFVSLQYIHPSATTLNVKPVFNSKQDFFFLFLPVIHYEMLVFLSPFQAFGLILSPLKSGLAAATHPLRPLQPSLLLLIGVLRFFI